MAADRPKKRTEGRGEAWLIGQLILFAAIALAPRRLPGLPEWPAWLARPSAIVGLVVGAAGALTALAGARALGSSLTIFPRPRDDGQLVSGGIYSVVRHPIYTGAVLGALGWALLRTSLPGLLLAVALAFFFDRKARREEQWLIEKYPEYAAYRARVRRRIL
jgi:protein-S-isoprenylcysteine O-methyltransferase Ste14